MEAVRGNRNNLSDFEKALDYLQQLLLSKKNLHLLAIPFVNRLTRTKSRVILKVVGQQGSARGVTLTHYEEKLLGPDTILEFKLRYKRDGTLLLDTTTLTKCTNQKATSRPHLLTDTETTHYELERAVRKLRKGIEKSHLK